MNINETWKAGRNVGAGDSCAFHVTAVSYTHLNKTVHTKAAIKYLGILLVTKLTLWSQIKLVADKAATVTAALSRIMANISGPKPSKRRLLISVTHLILLYGEEIWADALKLEKYRRSMSAVQWSGALRVACSYRMVSESLVLVLSLIHI